MELTFDLYELFQLFLFSTDPLIYNEYQKKLLWFLNVPYLCLKGKNFKKN